MGETILRGHRVAKGKAEGEAVVTREPLSFRGAVNPDTGKVVEMGHELDGVSIAGKIVVYPIGKGSTVGSYGLYEMVCRKTQPNGIINLRADPIDAAAAIFCNIPMVDKLDGNPLELIKTGDYVEIDADKGMVKVRPRASGNKDERKGR